MPAKTHVTTRITKTVTRTQTTDVKLAVLRKPLHDLDDCELACELYEMGYFAQEDALIALTLDNASSGLEVRKAKGEYVYKVANDAWFRKTLKIEEDRITLISPSGSLCLEPRDRVVIARLRDAISPWAYEKLEELQEHDKDGY